MSKLDDLKNQALNLASDLKQKGEQAVEGVKTFIANDLAETKADFQQAKEKAADKVEDVKAFVANDVAETKADLEQAKDKASELKDQAKDKINQLKG